MFKVIEKNVEYLIQNDKFCPTECIIDSSEENHYINLVRDLGIQKNKVYYISNDASQSTTYDLVYETILRNKLVGLDCEW